ncbi:hypothetical protein HYH03_006828 [Edaphochlamys debaryana]|uniref:Guanylate cyclase domain-containing protein n=1 Tax=Edaphochlamys debaryana TaxID=47281 RepID=A0A836C0T8_9CHLO|nr:hypothetical protein HYH03_006828 [Edaphochlamys debaryana]|eukprot:KAG2495222.1 hypothetical protein HYH03_006828 [Edaphochlamys debaryana]
MPGQDGSLVEVKSLRPSESHIPDSEPGSRPQVLLTPSVLDTHDFPALSAVPEFPAVPPTAGAGQIRFQLSEGLTRPPSAGPAGGVLAARRRLTMRQSMISRPLKPAGDSGDASAAMGGGAPRSSGLLGSGSFTKKGKRPGDPDSNRASNSSVGNGGEPMSPSDADSSPSGRFADGAGGSRRRSSYVPLAPWKRRILSVMNHLAFYWCLVFLTFFIIFEDDLKRACLPPTADLPLEITITVIFVLFAIEMALSSLLRPGYFLGFYFWLDAIATSSLVFEVPTVRIKFFGGSEYINLGDRGGFVDNAGDQLYISSKAGRVARIFRLLRMLRLYSLYTAYVRRRRIKAALEAAGASSVAHNSDQLSIIEFEMQQEQERKTRVGQKLEELTTRRIIVGVLIMILLVPAFDTRLGTFGRPRTAGETGLKMLHWMAVADGAGTPSFEAALETFSGEVEFNTGTRRTSLLLNLLIANVTYLPMVTATRRFEELYFYSYASYQCPADPMWPAGGVANGSLVAGPDGCLRWDTFALYDWKWYSQVNAILNIARSLFIIVLLVTGAHFLNRDSRNLVLLPIERMIQRVQEMSENPLALAESRLQLQAPWQDKLKDLSEGGGSGGKTMTQRDSLISAGGGGGGGSVDGVAAVAVIAPMPGGAASSGHTAVSVYANGAPVAGEKGGAGEKEGVEGAKGSDSGMGPGPGAGGGGGAEKAGKRLSDMSVGAGGGGADRGGYGDPRSSVMSQGAGTPPTGFSALQVRLWVAWVRLKEGVRNTLGRMWSYLWDGTAEDETGGGSGTAGAYETEVLENSIAKIGALLAIGFGDAGAEVIAENIRNDGDINPMVPGRKMVAIFGFCDIRRFTDTTEVLQEEVMEFVNSIAHVVHTSVSTHGGSPNKNIGDAFLLVWKFPRGFRMRDINNVTRDRRDASQVPERQLEAAKNLPLPGAPPGPDGTGASPAPTDPALRPGTALSVALTQGLGGLGGFSMKRRMLPLGTRSARVAPAESLSGGGGLAGAKASASLAHTMSLAQLADEGFGITTSDGTPGVANKMAVIRALMSLKQDVDLSSAAKREIIHAIADNALASFVIINLAIKRSARLKKYALRKDLNRRMPGFKISMGFGLHVGWAIEGAIGSEYKIDASYLSPNVNMASRLEAATKQFGVLLLLSEDFVECLSPAVRCKVRQIDCVTVKGSTQPMGLYTYDINMDAVPEPSDAEVQGGDDSAVEELMWRSYACSDEWSDNPELAASWGIDEDFKDDFDKGFHSYRVGDWADARRRLEECRNARVDGSGKPLVDGPSDVLLCFMAEHGYTAPPGWRGFRELTEK